MFEADPIDITTLREWDALRAHHCQHDKKDLRARLEEPLRFERLSVRHGDLLVDFSKQRLGEDTLALLVELAHARGLGRGIAAMAAGEAINSTEHRAALHVACRADGTPGRFCIGGQDVMPEVIATRGKVTQFARALQRGQILGATGKPIRQVVNLGIGGSDLGPRMVASALADCRTALLKVSFVASPDPLDFSLAVAGSEPEETLFIVSSKSFSTAETLANARAARDWLLAGLGAGAALEAHFAAVTNNLVAAERFGIRADRCLAIPEWVGGRFSLWSAIGLPVEAGFGSECFEQLLAGARDMDQHFLSAPIDQNLPVLLALVGLWNIDFLGIPNLAVLPYRYALRHFPAHLQQLEMESNGKCVTRGGKPLRVATAPMVWGCAGPLGQHAFHQLFFQGMQPVTIDFVVPVDAHDEAHKLILTQALAQSASLARGKTHDEAQAELLRKGVAADEVEKLAPHMACPGNLPSTTMLLPGLSPFTLGQLIALYEHKVFAQGWLWGINSFDQFGVEYGKTMAHDIAGGNAKTDGSTAGLWRHAEKLMVRANGADQN